MKKQITLMTLLLATGSVFAQAPVKKVLLEEFTTTLCGNCPPQSYNIHQWYEQHRQNAVLLVHHAGFGTDAMTNTEASAYASYFQPSTFGFAPAIMIDRDVYPWKDSVPYMSVGGFDTIALRISNDPTVVDMAITGTYNSVTRLLSVTATATFLQTVPSGDMRISLFMMEDSLVGTGSGWDQKCYSSSWANSHYPGQYNSSTQYITQYPHRNVQRSSLTGGTWGPSGSIPTTPVAGTPYSITTNYTVPANFNDARCSVVAYVANYGATKKDRNVFNACEEKITTIFSTSTGVAEQPASSEINAMYPNPAVNDVTIDMTIRNAGTTSIAVTNLLGQQVAVFEKGANLGAGRYESTFSTAELSSGVYVVTLKNEKEVVTRKLTVEK